MVSWHDSGPPALRDTPISRAQRGQSLASGSSRVAVIIIY